MATTQPKIAAKKCTESTGITNELAEQMRHRGEGGHYIAIVDLEYLDHTDGREDKHIVRLEISQLEIMPEGATADHARELMRSVYLKRQPEGLDGTEGEPIERTIERGKNTVLTEDEDGVHDSAPEVRAGNMHTDPTGDQLEPKRRNRKATVDA